MLVNEYDSKGIANIIRRYQELRSASQITSTQYERIGGSSSLLHGKDEIICVLADIDQGIATLSARQLTVVRLLTKGYQIEEIGKLLGLSPATVKFHIHQAVFQVTAYLNSSHHRKKGAH